MPARTSAAERRAPRLAAILAALVLLLSFFAFSHERAWRWMGVLPLHPDFADTVAILAAGQARQAGLNPYATPNPYDPLGRPHVYGPAWLVTGRLHLTPHDAWWLGGLLMVVFVGTASWVIAPRRTRDLFFAFLLLASPPVMLGVNRGNNDLVVLLMLTAAAWLIARSGGLFLAGAASILAAAAMLKLYPVVALPSLVMRRGRARPALLAIGAAALACAAVFWVWRREFLEAAHNAPRPQTIFAYGMPVFVMTWRALQWGRGIFIGSWMLGAVIVVALLAPKAKDLWNSVPVSGFSSACFTTGAVCWLFCFLVNSNYQYRLVLMLLPARAWFEASADRTKRRVGDIQVILWIALGWLSVPKDPWAKLAEDQSIANGPAWKWLEGITGLEQGLATMLTLALAVAVAGAFFRRRREPVEKG